MTAGRRASLESQVKGIAARLPFPSKLVEQAERLAKSVEDPAMADFLREAYDSNKARARIASIRTLIGADALDDAETRLRLLKNNLLYAEELLKRSLAERGLQFARNKTTRTDAMAAAIDDAFKHLGSQATPAQILSHLATHTDLIDEIDDDTGAIYWRAANGREAKMSRRTFENRVSARRKKL